MVVYYMTYAFVLPDCCSMNVRRGEKTSLKPSERFDVETKMDKERQSAGREASEQAR